MMRLRHIALFVLLAAVLVLAQTRYASAQNSAVAPYINSTHLYRVPMGNTGNGIVWEIRQTEGGSALYALSSLTAGSAWTQSQTWATAAIVGNNAEITIKFVSSQFTANQTYYLAYREYNAADGNCVAVRTMAIEPVANDFLLAAGSDYTDCNGYTGTVWPNDKSITAATDIPVSFTVNMSKNANHTASSWSFTGRVTLNGTGFSVPASADQFVTVTSGTSTLGGTYIIDNVTGGADNSFTVTVPIPAGQTAATADAITITLNLSGPAINTVGATLTISNGTANSGTNFTVTTDDNATGDHTQQKTFNPIPATPVIAIAD